MNIFVVVQVPVFLRSDERQMRLKESNGQKERLGLSLQSSEVFNGTLGENTIGISVIRHVR